MSENFQSEQSKGCIPGLADSIYKATAGKLINGLRSLENTDQLEITADELDEIFITTEADDIRHFFYKMSERYFEFGDFETAELAQYIAEGDFSIPEFEDSARFELMGRLETYLGLDYNSTSDLEISLN